jgi:outer membrane protein assembly factor BamE
MLTDLFHNDRWDYIFTIRRPGTEPQRRSVVALFDGDTLKKLEAPETLPSENEFVAGIVPILRTTQPRALELTEEQRKALPPPAPLKKEPDAAEPSGPARTYPPLEQR